MTGSVYGIRFQQLGTTPFGENFYPMTIARNLMIWVGFS